MKKVLVGIVGLAALGIADAPRGLESGFLEARSVQIDQQRQTGEYEMKKVLVGIVGLAALGIAAPASAADLAARPYTIRSPSLSIP
jgi:hypothetical protein